MIETDRGSFDKRVQIKNPHKLVIKAL